MALRPTYLGGLDSLRKVYQTFTIDDLDIPKVLKKNGTDNRDMLPTYYYRDDALDIWKVIQDYVGRLLRYFYKTDQDIEEDIELQGWAHDVSMEGFAWNDGNKRSVPEVITTVDQLIQLCTIIIFTSTAQHAAVNFGQMETYQFIPNSPGALRLPFHKKGEASMERIINTLPAATIASLSISFSYALSEYAEDEIFLGQFPERMFLEPEVIKIQNKFSVDLEQLGAKFKERNSFLKHPYTYLLPEKIPNSIAI